MSDPIDQPQQDLLSPDGRRRQESILQTAIGLGRRRRRQRIARRAAIVAVPFIALAVFVSLSHTKRSDLAKMPSTAPTPVFPIATKPANPIKPDTLIASTAAVRIERIQDDPTIVARYATASTSSITIERIDDNQLFKELAAANLRGGLATIGGHMRLVLSR
jgi:hypothetical protein